VRTSGFVLDCGSEGWLDLLVSGLRAGSARLIMTTDLKTELGSARYPTSFEFFYSRRCIIAVLACSYLGRNSELLVLFLHLTAAEMRPRSPQLDRSIASRVLLRGIYACVIPFQRF
jgi:hypothetical protein